MFEYGLAELADMAPYGTDGILLGINPYLQSYYSARWISFKAGTIKVFAPITTIFI